MGRSIPGVELGGRVLGTEQAWALSELPARLAVVGCGASGAEIASGFARLGSEVLLFEVFDRALPSEDADISRLVERGLKRQGIEVFTSTPIEGVRAGESEVSFTYGEESATVDYLVIATGRGGMSRRSVSPRPAWRPMSVVSCASTVRCARTLRVSTRSAI